jgi:hypothetical protein
MIRRLRALAAAAAVAALVAAPSARAQQAQQQIQVGPGCDQAAADLLQQAAINSAQQWADAGTSYYRQPPDLAGMSCLDNLLNFGLDGFFHIPTLDDLLNLIAQAICNKIQDLAYQALAPVRDAESAINNSISGLMGGANSAGSGLGLGSLGFYGGFNVNQYGGGYSLYGDPNSQANYGVSNSLNNLFSRPTYCGSYSTSWCN